MRCTATFMRHLNTWGKITKERKSLIMRITKSRIMARLAATGRAYVAEDTTSFQDGEDEDRLLQYMQTQIGTTERLTMIPTVASGHSGEIVTTDATAYDVDDDDVEIVEDSQPSL